MKKLIILTLICFALAGIGNVFSKSVSILSPSVTTVTGWAKFKELFH
jgi:hypothetical protein